jgi:hypothetical protein
MARSDFNWVAIRQAFTVDAPTVQKEFPIEGTQQPIDDAYLLLQIRGVNGPGQSDHKIFLNGVGLGAWDVPGMFGSNLWHVWVERVEPDLLKAGTNTIRIDRIGDDDFEVLDVLVHWREREPSSA